MNLPVYPSQAYKGQWKGWRDFLGTTSIRIWTVERIIEDARKYKTTTEWKKHSNSAYSLAKLRGCWEAATAHMPLTRWTKARVIAEARQFKTRHEWVKFGGASYSAAVRHKWLADVYKFMPDAIEEEARERIKNELTKEEAFEIAKRFKNRAEWSVTDRLTYRIVTDNGWMDDIMPRAHQLWSNEAIIADARKYRTREEWRVNSRSASSLARVRGCFEEATKHMPTKRGVSRWTKKLVIENARGFATVPQWRQARTPAYLAARKHGWLAEATAHMPPQRKSWTVTTVLENAKLYSTLSDWHEHDAGAYQAAKRKGIFEQATEHMRRLRRAWTKEEVQVDALKFSDSVTWKEQSRLAYQAAFKYGWFREVTAHMTNIRSKEWGDRIKETRRRRGSLTPYTKDQVMADARRFKRRCEWRRRGAGTYSSARINGWYEEATAHMKDGRKTGFQKRVRNAQGQFIAKDEGLR